MMQHVSDFITAVLCMFRASCAHHQEYKKYTDAAATGTGSFVKYNLITLTS